VFFPPRWEEEDAGVLAPAVKTSHLGVAGSPVSYTWSVRTRTSKHSAVRCWLFIGSKATGLHNQHEAETVIRTCGRGGIFGLAKHLLVYTILHSQGRIRIP